MKFCTIPEIWRPGWRAQNLKQIDQKKEEREEAKEKINFEFVLPQFRTWNLKFDVGKVVL